LPFLAALRPRDDRELFLVIWALVVLAFFSASGSKLPPYILPMFPALALLIGRRLAGDARRGLLIAQSALLVVMSIAGVILVAGFAPDNYADYARWLAVASALLGVAAICALVCALRSAITGAVVCLAAGGLIATVLGLAAHRTLSDRFSVASTVAKLAERPSASTPVFAVDMYDHTLPWSLKRTVTMVAHRDELEVAIGWEPQKFIRDLDAFAAVWRATPQAWAFVPAGAVDTLPAKLGIPMQVMARGSQYAIVKKP
jgi:4-amino-4-deoxy-L-arabinose transferase-like glycosyltransferase